MADHQDWVVGKYKIDEFFRFSREFRSLEHGYMLIAIAPNGGPIAITSDKKQILAVSTNDPTLENVCIFDNEGDIIYKIPIENSKRQVIVGFDFLDDERLLVVFQKAYFWTVDPNTGIQKKHDLKNVLKDGQWIRQAKVCGNGFGFLTTQNKFKLLQSVDEISIKQFYENQLEEVPSYWTIHRPREVIYNNIQINYPHPRNGIVQIFQNKRRKEDIRKRIIYNKQFLRENGPDIPYITYMSQISPNGRSIAYFCAIPVYKQLPTPTTKDKKKKDQLPPQPLIPQSYNYKLIITLADGTSQSHKSLQIRKLNQQFLNQSRCPRKIIWCGDDGIVIQYYNEQMYLILLPDYQMISIQNKRSVGQQFTFIRQQVDGIRLITKQKNKILRKIPTSYQNIFGYLSTKPSSVLFQTFEAFNAKQPFQDDQIKKNKKQLTEAVLDVINASRFQIEEQTRNDLLKTAAYGKSFLPPHLVPNSIIIQACKYMRVHNEIKISLKRVMTFAQFQALTQQGLLNILLRYNLHYLAFQVFRFLKKSLSFRVQIYSHWALCKILSKDSDESICQDIKRQLEHQKGVSFTQMAYKAIESGKVKLALKLLEEEPSLQKKIPLLLWMGSQSNESLKYYTKAISHAVESQDPDLLCIAIQQIRTSGKISEFQMFKLFSQSNQGRCALVSYYRIFDKSMLIKYYDAVKQYQNLGLFSLSEAYKSLRYSDHVKFMIAARAKFNLQLKNPMNQWRNNVLSQTINLYQIFIKNFPKVQFKGEVGGGKMGVKPGPINELIDIFIAKGNVDQVDNIKGLYKISDKRIVLSRIKALINQRRFQQLEKTLDQFQKKMKLPVQMFADMLLQKGEDLWALRILSKMPEKQKKQQYILLQRINKVKEAIDAATRRKDVQGLQEIRSRYLNDQLSTLPKK